ncbi:MAG: urease accessory protein UreD [Pseudomonadota bacterium]
MSAATFLSDRVPEVPIGLGNVRVSGGVSINCKQRLGQSRIVSTRERDGYKVRSPRRSEPPEAVLINTGGGIASGDDILHDVIVEDGADLTVTTQASERIYRSMDGATSKVDARIHVGAGAGLNWLPQDTIIFDQSRLERQITAEITDTSRLLIAETLVLGRAAMGETLTKGLFRDKWRVHREGKLAFAENVLLRDETFQLLNAAAIAGGAQAILTLVFLAPDAEDRLSAVREVVASAKFDCAASAWNRMLVVRGLALKTEQVRSLMSELVPALHRGTLPRVWWT